jgi:2-octaprenyl-6-methoxyphenol hydroxylase
MDACQESRAVTAAAIAVVGGGPAGLAAALALARLGAAVTLLDAGRARPPTRTAAIFPPSMALLRELGVWPALAARGRPLRGMRIVSCADDETVLDEVLFEPKEIGEPILATNLADADIVAVLDEAARAAGVRRRTGEVVALERDIAGVTLRLADDLEPWRGALVVGADGRNSTVRRLAAIPVDRRRYAQAALVSRFRHAGRHHGISIEIHRPGGPFTTVPLEEHVSNLVWVEHRPTVDALTAAPARFAAEVGRLAGRWLGEVGEVVPAVAYPLESLQARRLAAPRVVLMGEAAHAMSPIGAQGLNTSFADVKALAEALAPALARGLDPGRPETLLGYERARRTDQTLRSGFVDLLHRTVAEGPRALRYVAAGSLGLAWRLPPVRARLMRALLPDAAAPLGLRGPG